MESTIEICPGFTLARPVLAVAPMVGQQSARAEGHVCAAALCRYLRNGPRRNSHWRKCVCTIHLSTQVRSTVPVDVGAGIDVCMFSTRMCDLTSKRSYRKSVVNARDDIRGRFRLLCRRHGANLCYTEMFVASEFAASGRYRSDALGAGVTADDAPLLVQFASRDPAEFAAAAVAAAALGASGADLNLGCPQLRAQQRPTTAFEKFSCWILREWSRRSVETRDDFERS